MKPRSKSLRVRQLIAAVVGYSGATIAVLGGVLGLNWLTLCGVFMFVGGLIGVFAVLIMHREK